MRMVDIIEEKVEGKALSDEEIRFFIDGYTKGSIPDYQASAWAMAVLFQGMTPHEIATLTDAMEHSGEEPGTVLMGKPSDLAKSQGMNMSLHDLRLVDLFDAAILLDYNAEGLCIAVQVENADPQFLTQDLTPRVRAAVPLLIDTLAAELAKRGAPLIDKATGQPYLGPQ